jgi:oligopeptide/dipeptide ABC transporter ATP-binding protein
MSQQSATKANAAVRRTQGGAARPSGSPRGENRSGQHEAASENILLEVRGLSKTYSTSGGMFARARKAHVVHEVGFMLDRGQTFALVGESGSGKTTIGRMLLRLVEADAGSVVFDGTDLLALPSDELRAMRRRIQIIFQDPVGSLDPRVRIGEAIAQPIRLHRLRPAAEIGGRVAELMSLVGLDPAHASRFPHEFSGGQRQRIAIARAIAVEPELIVCDEPVSALDLSIQAQVVNLLADLRDRLGLAYVFISHDMAVVRHLATDIGVLYAGRLVEVGPAEKVFSDPRHPYTRMLLAATPSPVPGSRLRATPIEGEPPSPFDSPTGCPFASRCPYRQPDCDVQVPPLRSMVIDIGATRQVACRHAESLPPFVALSDSESLMSERYRRRLMLLRGARLAENLNV